jgi:hypothetical protein
MIFKKNKPRFVVAVSDGVHIDFEVVRNIVGYNEGIVLHYKPENGLDDLCLVGRKFVPLEQNGTYFVGKNLGNVSVAALCAIAEGLEVVKQGENYFVKVSRNGTNELIPIQDVAVPLIGKSADPSAPGEDYSAMARGNLYGQGLLSLTGKVKIPWNIIIIVGLIAIGILIAVKTGHLHL